MPFEPYGDHIDQHGTPLRKDYTSSHTVGIQSVGDWGTHGASLVAGRLVISEKGIVYYYCSDPQTTAFHVASKLGLITGFRVALGFRVWGLAGAGV